MDRHIKTRSQRRMEKRQALTVLTLVLVVSLASFTLGVMVGRRGSAPSTDVATEKVDSTPVQTVQQQAQPIETVQPVTPPPVVEEPAVEEEDLSFYNRLPDGEAPLGSGINMPPDAEKKPVQLPVMPDKVAEKIDEVTAPPAKVETPEPVKVAKPAPAPKKVVSTAKKSSAPAATAGGDYAIQVGSFKTMADADVFKKKLSSKGFPAFVVPADLGSKGVWYRVRVGPFDKPAADAAVKQLKEGQNISGFVTRM